MKKIKAKNYKGKIEELQIDYNYIVPSQEVFDQLSIDDITEISDVNLENLANADINFDVEFVLSPKAENLFQEVRDRRKYLEEEIKKYDSVSETIKGEAIDNTKDTIIENPSEFGSFGYETPNKLFYKRLYLANLETVISDINYN